MDTKTMMTWIPRSVTSNPNDKLAKQETGVAGLLTPRTSLLFLLATIFLALVFGTKSTHAQTEKNQPASEAAESDLDSILITGTCMGPIQYQVTVVDPPSDQTEASLEKAIQATLDRINERMSTYIDDSYVSKFNVSQSTDFITCDEETALVVQRAIEISKLTDGAFDVTVGPAVELWSFGRTEWRPGDPFEPPSEAKIKKSLEVVGYKKLTVRLDPPSIKKEQSGRASQFVSDRQRLRGRSSQRKVSGLGLQKCSGVGRRRSTSQRSSCRPIGLASWCGFRKSSGGGGFD